MCDAIRVVRLPYHLSAVTQAVALAALRHADELLARVDDLRRERDATVADLDALLGLPAEGSQLFKVNGKYYLFNITWPKGGMRTVVVHRVDDGVEVRRHAGVPVVGEVLVGFVGGLALDIGVSQVAKMLGITIDSGGEFVEKMEDLKGLRLRGQSLGFGLASN